MFDAIRLGSAPCQCQPHVLPVKRVVLTGGPSAGKTEIFRIAQQVFCRHVAFVPEAATMVYSWGTPRGNDKESIKATQRKIFQTQRELEQIAERLPDVRLIVYDRCALDGLAYWPDTEGSFWEENASSLASQYGYFDVAVHLRTPSDESAYSLNTNPIRTESVELALTLDRKNGALWDGHPNRVVIGATADFSEKVVCTIDVLRVQFA